jgi:hypothetical protein
MSEAGVGAVIVCSSFSNLLRFSAAMDLKSVSPIKLSLLGDLTVQRILCRKSDNKRNRPGGIAQTNIRFLQENDCED